MLRVPRHIYHHPHGRVLGSSSTFVGHNQYSLELSEYLDEHGPRGTSQLFTRVQEVPPGNHREATKGSGECSTVHHLGGRVHHSHPLHHTHKAMLFLYSHVRICMNPVHRGGVFSQSPLWRDFHTHEKPQHVSNFSKTRNEQTAQRSAREPQCTPVAQNTSNNPNNQPWQQEHDCDQNQAECQHQPRKENQHLSQHAPPQKGSVPIGHS